MPADQPSATKPLVSRDPIRLAMLGCSADNGHPYSWSAILPFRHGGGGLDAVHAEELDPVDAEE
jgi:hypothetical protein